MGNYRIIINNVFQISDAFMSRCTRGPVGPPGSAGERGPQGPRGEQGLPGEKGTKFMKSKDDIQNCQ